MAYYLTYKINGIQSDGEMLQFVMPVNQADDVKYVTTQVKKEFGIIPELTAKIYGSDLQGSSLISQCIRGQDVVTFDVKESNGKASKLDFYRQPILAPKYQNNSNKNDNKRTFIVFTTANFQSMTTGDKIQIDITGEINNVQNSIKNLLSSKYKMNVNAQKILVFLPGGVPFLISTISEFIKSFPDYMPHLYAIIITNDSITDSVLEERFDIICNIKDPKIRSLISPDIQRDVNGLCEMASILGYIQQNGANVKRMIYSIAKFCPFAPMICGLYSLACLSRATGRTILQITSPLTLLFKQMNINLKVEDKNLFSNTVKFLTYFMNIKISDRIPCTEFIRPFYKVGYEQFFYENFNKEKLSEIQNIVSFDPDFRDHDWIRFQLPSLTEEDFEDAMEHTSTLSIIPPMSLREMHRVSLFRGLNGPWLFLAASISKEETEKDMVDYINPEKGEIEHDTYENIAVKVIGVDYRSQKDLFNQKVTQTIDEKKVTQLVIICIDKSESMLLPLKKEEIQHVLDLYFSGRLQYGTYEDRFTISQKFFTKFIEACYQYHNTSLYGSIMFNHQYDVRNELNPLAKNFVEIMIKPGDKPDGGTRMFTAIKVAADRLLTANRGNKYPNAVLRIIVISDGIDQCSPDEMYQVMNYVLQNHIRVDGIIVSDEIAKELVAISRFSGGISIFPRTLEEGLDFFNKEEFFNVDLRQFGEFRAPNVTLNEVVGLRPLTINDLDSKIDTKPNQYANLSREVTSPSYAITEFEKQLLSRREGNVASQSSSASSRHPRTKRIIFELRKIITDPDEDIRVYPLKDRVDVWRVLIKGFEGSLYQNKWFYLIIEFTPEYPNQYPLFRFVHPPFHPNITDQGRICLDTIDQSYRNDRSIRELIGDIRYLLFNPNFASAVDLKRAKYKDTWGREVEDSNGTKKIVYDTSYQAEVEKWNNTNGRDKPEDWEKTWKIQEDTEDVKQHIQNLRCAIVPEQFLCPINRTIMKEPVKASSGVYYEKVALEKYLNSTKNPTCRAKNGEDGKPVPLPKDKNMNLQIDNEMKTKIANWIKSNHYREDEEEGDEEENIFDFKKKNISINSPVYVTNLIDKSIHPGQNHGYDDDDFESNILPSRIRPVLSEA